MAVCLLGSSTALAQSAADPVPPDELFQPYTDPAGTVALADGRELQLVCTGEGSPTVILSAGAGAPAGVWYAIQPAIATHTRVCSWSRAGLGLSSPSRIAQTVDNTTNDLDEALRIGGIRGPVVLAGASLGGYETALFADRHRAKVAGLVFIDASVPDQYSRFRAVAPEFMSANDQRQVEDVRRMYRCAAGLRSGAIASGGPDPDRCLASPIPPQAPPVIHRLFGHLRNDADRWQTVASLIGGFEADALLAVNPGRNYGDIPIIVLTAGEMSPLPPDAPAIIKEQYPAMFAEFGAAQAGYAALSTRGMQRVVPESSHDIPSIKPDAVVAAIVEVLDMVAAQDGASGD